jgi:hypothetical protein
MLQIALDKEPETSKLELARPRPRAQLGERTGNRRSQKLLAIDPSYPALTLIEGVVGRRRSTRGRAEFSRDRARRSLEAWNRLVCLRRAGRDDEAVTAWKARGALDATEFDAMLNLSLFASTTS